MSHVDHQSFFIIGCRLFHWTFGPASLIFTPIYCRFAMKSWLTIPRALRRRIWWFNLRHWHHHSHSRYGAYSSELPLPKSKLEKVIFHRPLGTPFTSCFFSFAWHFIFLRTLCHHLYLAKFLWPMRILTPKPITHIVLKQTTVGKINKALHYWSALLLKIG